MASVHSIAPVYALILFSIIKAYTGVLLAKIKILYPSGGAYSPQAALSVNPVTVTF